MNCFIVKEELLIKTQNWTNINRSYSQQKKAYNQNKYKKSYNSRQIIRKP